MRATLGCLDQTHIRPATWRDLRALWSLERACFGRDAWPLLDVLVVLTLPGTIRLKAEVRDESVGFVFGDRRSRGQLGWVASIGVDPRFRRRGIGRALLKACERALGTPRVRLTLRKSNQAALELYRSSGYEPVGEWRGYYRDGEAAMVMERILEGFP